MATIKVKFRASSVPGKEGTLYYHLIHQRNLRWISTDYHVFPEEWNDKKSAIIVSNRNNRQAHLQLIQSQIDWEMKQMQRIIHDKEMDGIPYTIDDIAKEIQQLPPNKSVFTFFRQQIAKKEQMQCIGTQSNYTSAANRFMEFRHHEDLTFSQMTSEMMEMYRAWLFNRGIGQNTVSFYLRTLRTLYNKAVETGHAPAKDIFAHVQTANVRTAKRAISVKDIRKIENLELPTGSSLDKARDLFLLSFYLRGMAFVDMAFLKKNRLEMWLGELQPSQDPPKSQYRVDEADASHHRQVRPTNKRLPLPATHLDRQGILSIHGIPQGGAQHQLQPEENR